MTKKYYRIIMGVIFFCSASYTVSATPDDSAVPADDTVPDKTAVDAFIAFLRNTDLVYCELIERIVQFHYWSEDPFVPDEKSRPITSHFLEQQGSLKTPEEEALQLLRKDKPGGLNLTEPLAGHKRQWVLDRKQAMHGDSVYVISLMRTGSLQVEKAVLLMSGDSDNKQRRVYQKLPSKLNGILSLNNKNLIDSFERKIKKVRKDSAK